MNPPKHELVTKYETSESFKKEMLKAQQNYKILKQHAHFSNLTAVNELLISKFEPQQKQINDIYFVYGVYMNKPNVTMDMITGYFVTVFQKPKKSYIFVYFNDYESTSNFTSFKNMLSIMPLDFLTNLQAIYVVKPTLKMKATNYLAFGTIAKYLSKKTQYVNNIGELGQKINYSSHQIMNFLPLDIRNDFSEEQNTTNLPIFLCSNPTNTTSTTANNTNPIPNYQNRITQAPKSSQEKSKIQSTNPKNMTSSHKPATKADTKLEIDQYDKSDRGIPVVFEVFIHYFRQNHVQLEEEGLFRKSVNIQEQLQAIQQMKEKHYEYLQKVKDPHLVANLMKRFLSKLKTPIIPYKQFEQLMSAPNISVELLQEQIRKISKENSTKYLTLMLLLDFLNRKVIPRANKNKMNVHNLSVCFAPCLMWAQQKSLKDLAYINKSVLTVNLLLTNFQDIFGTKEQVKRVIRSSYFENMKKSIAENYKIQATSSNTSLANQRNTPNFGYFLLQMAQQQYIKQEQGDDSADQVKSPKLQVNFTHSNKQTKSQCQKGEEREDPDDRKSDNAGKKQSSKLIKIEPPTNAHQKKGIFTSKNREVKQQQKKGNLSSDKSGKAKSTNSDK